MAFCTDTKGQDPASLDVDGLCKGTINVTNTSPGVSDAVMDSGMTITTSPNGGQQQSDRNTPFPFSKLPLELRRKIYSYQLVADSTVLMLYNKPNPRASGYFEPLEQKLCLQKWYALDDDDPRVDLFAWHTCYVERSGYVWRPFNTFDESDLNQSDYTPDLALLIASKWIHLEATPIFFGLNAFEFYNCNELRTFLSCASQVAKNNIRKLTVTWSGKAIPKTFDSLRDLPNLKELHLKVTQWLSTYYMRGPHSDRRVSNHSACKVLRMLQLDKLELVGDAIGLQQLEEQLLPTVCSRKLLWEQVPRPGSSGGMLLRSKPWAWQPVRRTARQNGLGKATLSAKARDNTLS
ncbi:hypothetical protein MMC16_006224 [Acarospora aff. strigata]|nr:hypothetical protein [Acarospora aff. strigata]